MKNMKRSTLIIAFIFIATLFKSPIIFANNSLKNHVNVSISSEWGEPEFNRYKAMNETNQWLFTRKEGTLSITKTKCPQCKLISQQEIDEYNSLGETSNAIMLNHKGTPAMLQLLISDKGVNIRSFKIFSNGFYYDLQLGTSQELSSNIQFKMENEFLKMINGLTIQ